MKYQFLIVLAILLFGCKKEYSLSTAFEAPTSLDSPSALTLDVKSDVNITLSWTGGGASDSSYVTYIVLFDKPGGDFSSPLFRSLSDNGAYPRLTLSQATLNTIARKAGIMPDGTGDLIWTVIASKGGNTTPAAVTKTVSVTRGEGIDNMPTNLYLSGSGSEMGASGQLFRKVSEGVYVIYSKVVGDGEVEFKSDVSSEATQYFAGTDGKLKEGSETYILPAKNNPYRITVNFNTLSVKAEEISDVRCIWGATYGAIGNLAYIGNGKFQANDSRILFIQQDRPETNPPGWLSWIEERYYFIAKVNGNDVCWGRKDGISGERPTGNEPLSFYEIGEFSWSQWDHLWKMKGDLDLKKCTITINTNLDNLMVHQFSNITSL